MKKLFVALILALLATLFISSCALAAETVDWDALIDSGEAAETTLLTQDTSASVAVDWGAILSDIVTYALGAVAMFIAGVIVYVIIRYLIPVLPAFIQWLNDKRMLWLARILVNAAEVLYGRFKGSKKLDKVYQWMRSRGILVTDEVQQMIDNAWQELNNKMIELGLKEAKPAGNENSEDPFTGSDEPVPID